MTNFIDREGAVSLQLSKVDQTESIEAYDSRVPVQYETQMSSATSTRPSFAASRNARKSRWFWSA